MTAPLSDEGRAQLEALAAELEAAALEDRPARYVVDGNGVDFTGIEPAARRASQAELLDEVRARLAGIVTPAQALGEAVHRLNLEGWP